jgi:peptidoglycan hydrolase CwlO-like protein
MRYGMRWKRFLLLFLSFLGILFVPSIVMAQCATIQECNSQISEYTSQLSKLGKESKTLSDAISVLNLKMNLIQRQIDATQFQIQLLQRDIESLTGKISLLEGELNNLTNALLENVAASYKRRNIDGLQTLVSSRNFSDAIAAYKYLSVSQKYRQDLLFKTTQTKVEYDQEKSTKEQKQKEIAALKKQYERQKLDLAQQQKAKRDLLAQTKNSEANYQRLLAEAKAQLAGFSAFTTAAGGASLLSGQTSCDDWGCYYNQRDGQWGAMSLNGTQYTLASDGCLVTSMAMILTHYGHRGVTPVGINANPNNFASYYPAYLLYTIQVDGVTAQRASTVLDSFLSSGHPVVVGMRFSGGRTHFVVIKSGSNGSYIMHDPFLPNGKNVNFTDHYAVGNIYEIHKVIIN